MLIGRKDEVKRLEKLSKSPHAEFVVLYGRRRIGKTYLIREFFSKKEYIFFQATGLLNGSLKKQLSNFTEAISQIFARGIALKTPTSWDEAFKILNQFIENITGSQKVVIFMDEVPWMATRKSGFLEALDYYWNHYWVRNKRIILVTCGSSASWLIKNILYNKGGLHNRCTCEIKLEPFSLEETSLYLNSRGVKLNKRHVLELYMALGGIPYYLNYVEAGQTATENIQNIFFDNKAPLRDEFKKLFSSLFYEADVYVELIRLIASKKEGMSRSEIEILSTSSPGGGRLTVRLNNLMQTNFIEAHIPWNKQRGEYFKVIDEFCLFHLYWLDSKNIKKIAQDYWFKQLDKPTYQVWAGYAFEAICYKHINNIMKALNIKTAETISSWRLVTRKKDNMGAQIDLLIDRHDDAITVCEIKYTDNAFIINKNYAENLQNKLKVFKEHSLTHKHIFLAIISANGVKQNSYYNDLVDNIVTLEDIF